MNFCHLFGKFSRPFSSLKPVQARPTNPSPTIIASRHPNILSEHMCCVFCLTIRCFAYLRSGSDACYCPIPHAIRDKCIHICTVDTYVMYEMVSKRCSNSSLFEYLDLKLFFDEIFLSIPMPKSGEKRK